MPARDIMPFVTLTGKHPALHYFRMGALTTGDTTENTGWETGYLMVLAPGTGDIDCFAGNDVLAPSAAINFIAAAGSNELLQLHNGTSGAATHDIYVPVYSLSDGQEFITRNVVNGNDTALTPIEGNGVFLGVTCDFRADDAVATKAGHIHAIDLSGDGMIITRILDDQGRDSHLPGAGTPTQVVFKLITAA